MSSLKRDLGILERDFGISPILIEDIQKSPEMANGAIKVFGRSMYIFNGLPIFMGLACILTGASQLFDGFYIWALILLLAASYYFAFSRERFLFKLKPTIRCSLPLRNTAC